MDHESNPINSGEKRRGRVPYAIERGFDGFEERVLWPLGDAGRALVEVVRSCFEWIAWVVRRGLLWPLQDRFATLGAPGRVLSAVAVALVVGVGVGVAAIVSGGGGGSEPAPVSQRVAVVPEPAPKVEATPAPQPAAAPAPTLKGATPVFEAKENHRRAGEVKQAEPVEQSPAATATPSAAPSATSADPATATIGSGPAAGATTSTARPNSRQSSAGIDGRPAGPEAIAVARDFAGAFVLYETGGEESKVRKAFGETATEELAKSLLQRPPRLPSNVEVPKAKVVNVVAGPSQGGVYSVSVSLLRVGLTSELRLDLEKLKGKGWRVTNVLG